MWPTTYDEEEELPPPFYENGELWKMKLQERDELWGRLDERTCNIWVLTEKMEKHLKELNDSVAKNTISCSENKTSNRNLWTVIGFIIFAVATAIGLSVAL